MMSAKSGHGFLAAAAGLILAVPAHALAAQWEPIFDASALMGQVLFQGQTSAWQGNADMSFSPAVKFNEHWALIPTYAASYRGTKNVAELAGGGQLFQDEQTHALLFKGIFAWNHFRIKPQAGYRWDFLRETVDESIGTGLFDYQKPSAGLEAEWRVDDARRVSAAFDWYQIHFPNYVSLDSQVIAQGLGREQATAHALDSDNYSWTVTGQGPLPIPGVLGTLSLNYTDRYYGQQPIVSSAGTLIPDLRSDSLASLSGRALYRCSFMPALAAIFSMGVTETRVDSNQNHYDAGQNIFTPDYYTYQERVLEPQVTFIIGRRKGELSISYMNSHRAYENRQAQSSSGTYLGQAVVIEQNAYIIGLAIPVGGGFKIITRSSLINDSSNMQNQATFIYNYRVSSHLVGFSYSL